MCIFTEEELLNPDKMKTESLLIDHDTSENADQGYSAWVELENGSILMANYIMDDAPKHI